MLESLKTVFPVDLSLRQVWYFLIDGKENIWEEFMLIQESTDMVNFCIG